MKLQLKRNDQIGLLFFIAFVAGTSLIWLFEERFDQNRWKTQRAFRYEMAKDIIESNLFINKTKDYVITVLGQPNESNSKGKVYLSYYLGRKPSFFNTKPTQLIFSFKNGRVKKVIEEAK